MTRILCLHGYTQDGDTLRRQIGALRKCFNKSTEFVFIEAPYKASDVDPTKSGLAFWHPSGDLMEDIRGSVKYIHDYIRENGPFDGVLGFSQGSSVITIYQSFYNVSFKFALVFSASRIVSELTLNQLNHKIKTPCLHVCGENDDVCSTMISTNYMEHAYTDIKIYKHKGGHGIPLDKDSKILLKNFIKSHIEAQ